MKWFFQAYFTGIATMMLLICLLASFALPHPSFAQHTQTAADASITVNAKSREGVIPPSAFGINEAAWDGYLLDAKLPSLLAASGARIMRYPGGSLSDGYHWQSNTTQASYVNPSNTFDTFMKVAQHAGIQPIITVDYGAGTPQEAAGWVQYANKGGPGYTGPVPTYAGGSSTGHRYGIKYWEIGNEIYGDGTYTSQWELNHHTLGPTTYANNVVAFSKAMKAVDPSIKTGLVLTTPGYWPDGQTSSSSPRPWNDTVLPLACSAVDFMIIHWYPYSSSSSPATVLSTSSQIRSMVSTVRSKINRYCGSQAHSIQIMVTETNGANLNSGQRATGWYDGLFLADMYMTMLENRVASVDWWETHDDLLSSGACKGSTCDPSAETPFPPYYALQMVNHLGQAGATMVSTSSSQSLVAVHAVRQTNGSLAVLLVNKDPTNSYTLSLRFTGYTASATARIYTYRAGGGGITSTSGSSSEVTIPPYSLITLVLRQR
jgi:alpha-L-arabinofuranosidase